MGDGYASLEGQMKTSFKMEAPLVWNDGYIPGSGYSKLVSAIGRVLGGFSVDGTSFSFAGGDFDLAVSQLMLTEAGVTDLFPMGISQSVDGKSSFVAMSDGSVWKFQSTVVEGRLVTDAAKVEDAVITKECANVVAMAEAVKIAALRVLSANGHLKEEDKYLGNVVTDAHSAILMRPFAYGVIIIKDKEGATKIGFKFGIDAPRNSDNESVEKIMRFIQLTDEEISAENKKYNQVAMQSVDGNPFPQKIGMA